MQLLDSGAHTRLIGASKREAFHLELRDSYDSPGENEAFRNWLEGGSEDNYGWFQGWLSTVRGLTGRGAVMRRVRVVTVPHTDYIQWELELARLNAAAGEQIGYVPRHLVDANRLTTFDWWLLDDETVTVTVFKPSGQIAGSVATSDQRIVAYCQEVRDYVWSAAVPYADYVALQTR
ncbi:hypothetical protein HLB23_08070 [Nocardia uniformis]|uniref:DUF6879 domain-containing protein n=1 Tax=Nocardia uniformis TaxID=53432 RepID=A0A849BT75_9NOCA|nr:DUF6879 family protein [Nocardia uniformis]NNH69822.1 hypothetical protein [Nocardia uniformis]